MKNLKTQLIAIGLLASLLTAATVVATRRLKHQGFEATEQTVLLSNHGESAVAHGAQVDTILSDEMPEHVPDVAGVLVKREDNRIFVGTGNLSGSRLADGKWTTQHDGPVTEVVLSHETAVYQDDTLASLGGELPAGPVDQVLVTATLDDIVGGNTQVMAWGERRGDRLFATALIFIPFS
jgi:hypothetical protein